MMSLDSHPGRRPFVMIRKPGNLPAAGTGDCRSGPRGLGRTILTLTRIPVTLRHGITFREIFLLCLCFIEGPASMVFLSFRAVRIRLFPVQIVIELFCF